MQGGGSEKGKQKDAKCTVCGIDIQISAYARADIARCPDCKKGKKKPSSPPMANVVTPAGGMTEEQYDIIFGRKPIQNPDINPMTGLPKFLEERVMPVTSEGATPTFLEGKTFPTDIEILNDKIPEQNPIQEFGFNYNDEDAVEELAGATQMFKGIDFSSKMNNVIQPELSHDGGIQTLESPIIGESTALVPIETSEPIVIDTDSGIRQIRVYKDRSDIKSDVIFDTGEIKQGIPSIWKIKKANTLDYLSVSKMDAYQRCPRKFKLEQLDGATTMEADMEDGGNIFTWFGTILHDVSEHAEETFQKMGITVDPIMLFDESWKNHKLTDFSMYKEAKELIVDYFTRNPIDKPRYKTIAIEAEWRGEIRGVPFGCKMDKVGEINPTTGKLIDYKTNRQPYTQWELGDSLQLTTYEMIARIMYPQYTKWETGFEMFRFGYQQCPERTQTDLDNCEQFIENIYHQITHDVMFEERLNTFCGYCRYKQSCTKYTDYMNDPEKHLDTIYAEGMDLEQLEASRKLIGTYAKITKDRKSEIETILKTYINTCQASGQPCILGGKELYTTAQKRENYKYSEVRDILLVQGKANLLDGCTSITKGRLDTKLKSDPRLAMELKNHMSVTYNSPYIMARKPK